MVGFEIVFPTNDFERERMLIDMMPSDQSEDGKGVITQRAW